MLIEELEVRDLRGFRFGNTNRLSVHFLEKVQVVLGTNGSGKSRYINQLVPYPVAAPKSTYAEGSGYRRMVITDQGTTYELENDYTRKDGAHRFYITNAEHDRVNLNTSGNTNIQKELIDQYFNLTKERSQLLFGEISITSMSAGPREALLTKLAPGDLWFMIDHQKKIAKAVRNLKAELVYLTKRESELLARIISDADRQGYQDRKAFINTEILALIEQKGKLSERKEVGLSALVALSSCRPSALIEQELATTTEQLDLLVSQYGDTLPSPETCQTQIAHTETRLKDTHAELVDLYAQIRKMEETLEKSSHTHTEEKTHRLEGLRSKLAHLGPICDDPLTREEVQSLREIRPSLEGILAVLNDLPEKLITRKEYRAASDRLVVLRNDRYRLTVRLEELQKKEDDLREQLNRSADIRGIEPCAKERCPLFSFAVSARTTREDDLAKVVAEQTQITERLSALQPECDSLDTTVSGLSGAMLALEQLSTLVSRAASLGRYLTSDLITILTNNPYALLNKLDVDLERAESAWEAANLTREIDKLVTELAANENIGEDYRAILIEEKNQKDQRGTVLNAQLLDLRETLSRHTADLAAANRIAQYQTSKDLLTGQIVDAKRKEQLSVEHTAITEQLYRVESDLSGKTSELGTIDNLLADQDRIVAQYEGEVKRRKLEVETNLKEQEDLAMALKGIPEQETKAWLGKLIRQVNVYLSLVWNHRFEVEFDPEKPLTYMFPKYVKDERTDDISEASKGEKKMLDLAFSLALRDSAGMNNYPLFLDEMGDGFDITHINNIVHLVKTLIENNHASQIVLVNHQAAVSNGLTNVQVFVVDDENVLVPEDYNQGITLE